MKKRIFFCVISLFSILISCSDKSQKENTPSPFVTLEKGEFRLNGKPFYPITLNYMVSMQTDENILWPCTYTGYNHGSKNLYTTKDSCLMQLKADMDLIKEMGFNTIRIVGIGEEFINKKTGELKIGAQIGNGNRVVLSLNEQKNYNKYFAALKDLFGIVNNAGLKMIFLTRMSADTRSTEDHLTKLASEFKNDSTILAYDLFNEPLYFDSLERTKANVYTTVNKWNKILKQYAPNQLSTIGLEGIREVFEWDPNILDLDFLTFHPYEYEPEQVRNEIYWYGKYVKKPWIIGETAIPADNDSVSYIEQAKFANKTLKQAYNCGAIGYSWWQYKDVEWFNYHANFMGVVALKGQTKTKNNELVNGTVKPVANEFKTFDPFAKRDTCICMSNYYNYTKNTTFRITGKFVDEDNDPIQGAVILGWNQYWTHSYHTISTPDGSFELLGSFPFYHWMASFTGYTMIRGDLSPNLATTIDKIPTLDLGTLKLEKLNLEEVMDSVQVKN